MIKKLSILFITLFLGLTTLAQGPGIPVIPPPTPPGGEPIPRSPSLSPVTVTFFSSCSLFVVENLEDVGNEIVSIVSPSGITYYNEVDSIVQPLIVIPVDLESGLWTVTVTTESVGVLFGYIIV